MKEVQALIQGTLSPQKMNVTQLLIWAEQHPDPQSNQYKLLELALNIVLASYLEKAYKHV